ncbi:MAG: MmcQ/YjbR family DNA-binding protein [Chloroflexia bacterium]|nr:MmcQ/YjbR family DNA-binding protein [Chloroflexia bacterium]
MADEGDVRRIALSLPEVTEDEDSLHFRVAGKGFAWSYKERIEGQRSRVERREVLAVRVSNDGEKQHLLAAEPDTFFTTAHYDGFPAVLIRLPVITLDELGELLTDAWRIQAPRRSVHAYDVDRSS